MRPGPRSSSRTPQRRRHQRRGLGLRCGRSLCGGGRQDLDGLDLDGLDLDSLDLDGLEPRRPRPRPLPRRSRGARAGPRPRGSPRRGPRRSITRPVSGSASTSIAETSTISGSSPATATRSASLAASGGGADDGLDIVVGQLDRAQVGRQVGRGTARRGGLDRARRSVGRLFGRPCRSSGSPADDGAAAAPLEVAMAASASNAPGSGAHDRQRPSAWFQQSVQVYCRQSMQKLKVWWKASS